MWIADGWEDYELLDCGGGEKLERWGKQILVRPDPQAIWETPRTNRGWRNAQGRYYRSSSGGGHWDKEKLPESWTVNYKDLKFQVKPMNFKHTGLFPEQAVNWDFAREKIKNAGRPVRVLNLFAYTGGATVACAAAGAQVCHVDAAKGMVNWARENARVSGLSDAPVRWIIDDCAKFVEREIRRGKVYDAIIMDPPSYGRGPGGEVWKLEDNLFPFVKLCAQVLSDKPLFVIINSYTTGLAPSVLGYMLHLLVAEKYGGKVTWDELDFAREKIKNAGRPVRVLNLFAYTGGATVACAAAGAQVCHVDAAKGMVNWARENARVSGLSDAPVRWIIDDCAKFVEREIRRGKVYDAIIMDPPSYGRGPGGEVWKLEDNLFPFVKLCAQVLSDKPLFVIINSYTTGLAPSVLGYMLHLLVAEKYGGKVTWDELGLPVTETGLALPCGATGRWFSE